MRLAKIIILSTAVFSLSSASLAQTFNTSNTNATAKTKNIYNWMGNLPNRTSNKVMSGLFGGYSGISGGDAFGTGTTTTEAATLQGATGQQPAILACDYARGWDYTTSGNEASLIDYGCNTGLKDHWNNGGLVQVSNHLPSPAYAGNKVWSSADNKDIGAFKTKIDNATYAKIFTSGTAENARWLAILDKVALGLQDLRDAGVTVIYRPLHEMNGDWFWWGATGYNTNDTTRQENFIRLYRHMYTYFTVTKGLNNLIWVYSPDQSRAYKTSFFPNKAVSNLAATNVVDIVGLDAYADSPSAIAGYSEMIALNKPFAFAEIGPNTTNNQFDYNNLIQTIKTNFPKTIYFLPWNNNWSPNKNLNSYSAYNDSATLNRGEIWSNFGAGTLTAVTGGGTGGGTGGTATTLFSFEGGNTQGWTILGAGITGPWSVTEWASAGTSSLKANVALANNSNFTLKNNTVQNFSGKTSLKANIRVASWGVVGSGLVVKLYIKTGSAWQWFDAGATTLAIGGQTTATLNLSGLAGLSDVKEIGVYVTTSASGNSGSTSVYVDNLVVQ